MEAALGIWVNQGLTGLRTRIVSGNRAYVGASADEDRQRVTAVELQERHHLPARGKRVGIRFRGGMNAGMAITMPKILKDFIADESGATAIEYGLTTAGISLAIISVANGLGARLNTKFTAINNSLHSSRFLRRRKRAAL
jgi:pilus assembly protein Flp/PilA